MSHIVLITRIPTLDPVVPRRSIELPIDILDHIFSFLKSHRKALLVCSKAHSVFSQIVERYRFHHIIISTGFRVTDLADTSDSSDLRRQLAETPRIVKYVAVLKIEFKYPQHQDPCPNQMESLGKKSRFG